MADLILRLAKGHATDEAWKENAGAGQNRLPAPLARFCLQVVLDHAVQRLQTLHDLGGPGFH